MMKFSDFLRKKRNIVESLDPDAEKLIIDYIGSYADESAGLNKLSPIGDKDARNRLAQFLRKPSFRREYGFMKASERQRFDDAIKELRRREDITFGELFDMLGGA